MKTYNSFFNITLMIRTMLVYLYIYYISLCMFCSDRAKKIFFLFLIRLKISKIKHSSITR